METKYFSETLVHISLTARRHIHEDGTPF